MYCRVARHITPFSADTNPNTTPVPPKHTQTFVVGGWLVSCFLPGGESSSFASSTPGPTVVAQSARRGASLEADCVRRGDELALVWKPRRPWLDTPTGTRVYLAHRALVEGCSARPPMICARLRPSGVLDAWPLRFFAQCPQSTNVGLNRN